MESINSFSPSLFRKGLFFVALIFCIIGLYVIITDEAGADIYGILFLTFFSILWLVCFYIFLVKYNFSKYFIRCKYPFLPEREYKINEIIGWNIPSRTAFIIYFESKKLKIDMSSKKSGYIINSFINENYDIIKERNIEKIKTEGYSVKVNKNSSIVFHENDFTLNNYKKQNTIYLYSDIQSLDWNYNINFFVAVIHMKNGNKIKFNTNHSRGGIGLFEFINEKQS
ncbi:MAG: hypothetical protein FWC36_02135 [Spirochaetes bacterium]|nr:hypothetical protein [Spirochaetota bacterium]